MDPVANSKLKYGVQFTPDQEANFLRFFSALPPDQVQGQKYRLANAFLMNQTYDVPLELGLQYHDNLRAAMYPKVKDEAGFFKNLGNSISLGRITRELNDEAEVLISEGRVSSGAVDYGESGAGGRRVLNRGNGIAGVKSAVDYGGSEAGGRRRDFDPRAGKTAEQNLEEARKKIAELRAKAEKLADSVPSNAFSKAIGDTAQSLVMTAEGTVSGMAAGLINPALGIAVSTAVNSRLYRNLAYLDMIDSNIDHETAKRFSLISGWAQGGIEAALGAVPIGGIASKVVSKTIARKWLANGTSKYLASNFIQRFGRNLVMNIADIPMEGVEEAAQALAGNLMLDLAAEASEFGVNRDVLESKKEGILDSFKAGVVMSLILGIPSHVVKAGLGVDKAAALAQGARETVRTAPSVDRAIADLQKTDFGKAVDDTTLREFAKVEFEKNRDFYKEAGQQAELERKNAPAPTREHPAAARRREDGRLAFALTRPAAQDGTESGNLAVVDPKTGQRYGRITYRIDGDTVKIDSVKTVPYITDRDAVIADAVKELAADNPRARIQWKPESEDLKAIREQLIADNPDGTGLQWFDGKRGYAEQHERAEHSRLIERAAPQIPREQRETFFRVLAALNHKAGESTAGFFRRVSFINSLDQAGLSGKRQAKFDAAQKAGKIVKGATFDVADAEGKLKRYIYLGTEADFSTLNHEVFHDFMLSRDTDERRSWEDALEQATGKRVEDWDAPLFERNGEKLNAHEYLAEAFEDYLAGKKDPASSALKELFDKIMEFMRGIYGALRDMNEVHPELKRKFDELFSSEHTKEHNDDGFRPTAGADKEAAVSAEIAEGSAGRFRPYTLRHGVSGGVPGIAEEAESGAGGDYRGDQADLESNARVLFALQDGTRPTARQTAEAKRQYDEAESRYKDTPQWMKAPNGEPTKLTERQWVQVRTPLFKQWFGDWERAAIIEGDVLKSVNASDIPITGKGPIATAKQWIQDNPQGTARAVTIDGTFDIEIRPDGIDSSFSGKHTKYPNKVYVLPAVKEVIERGAYLGHLKDLDGKPIENYYFAAPVEINGERKIVFVRAREAGNDTKRFYVHEVFTEEEIKMWQGNGSEDDLASTDLRPPHLYKKILHDALNVNDISKAVDRNGEPQVTRIDGEDYWVNTQTGQRKSATANAGTFSGGTGNIYHQTEDAETADNEGMREAQRQAHQNFVQTWWAKALNHKSGEEIPDVEQRIFQDADGYAYIEKAQFLRHVYNTHGNELSEKARGQIAIKEADFHKIPNIIQNFSFALQDIKYEGRNAVLYAKQGENNTFILVFSASKKKHRFTTKTFWNMNGIKDISTIVTILQNNHNYDLSNMKKIIGSGGGGHPPDTAHTKVRGTVATSVNPADLPQISPGSPEKSSTSSPGGNNSSGQHSTGVKSFTDEDSVPALLFQLSQAHIDEDAMRYPTWQAWRDASQTAWDTSADKSQTVEGSIPDDVAGWDTDDWYRDTWFAVRERQRAALAGNSERITMSEAKRRLLDKLNDDTALDDFLTLMGRLVRGEQTRTGPSSQEEAAYFDSLEALRDTIEREVHPTVLNNARRILDKDLTDTGRKAIRTIIERGARTYLGIYAELTGDREFSGYVQTAIEDNRYEAKAAKAEGMSAYQRARLAKDIRNEELAAKAKSGELTGEEQRERIAALEEEVKAEAKLRRDSESMVEDYKGKLEAEESNYFIQASRANRLSKELAVREKEAAALQKKLDEAREAKGKANLAGRMYEAGHLAPRLEKARRRIAELKTLLKASREEAAYNVKWTKAEAALAAEMAVGKTKARMKRLAAEKDAHQRLLDERRRIVKNIMKEPSAAIDRKEAETIKAIQQAYFTPLNPAGTIRKVTIDGRGMSVEEFKSRAAKGELDLAFFDKHLQERMTRHSLNELSLNELKELEAELDDMRAQGRAVWRERQERERAETARDMRLLRIWLDREAADGKRGAAKRLRRYLEAGSDEERKKILNSADAARLFMSTLQERNFINWMDGGEDGILTRLILDRGDKAYTDKHNALDPRMDKIFVKAKELGLDVNKLAEPAITIAGAGKDGGSRKFSIAELMLAREGLKNHYMWNRIIYGTLFSDSEKAAWKRAIDEASAAPMPATTADNEGMRPPRLQDSIETILNGTPEEKKKLEMSYFSLADTPKVLQDHGLTGDYFSVRYGVIARHKGKDANHNLSAQNWKDLCEEITRPFAVVKHENGYRMLVNVKVNNNLTAVGVDVKKVGRNLEVNSISTVFGYEGSVKGPEFVYVAESLTPEQLALLDSLNYHQYLAARGGGGGRDSGGNSPLPVSSISPGSTGKSSSSTDNEGMSIQYKGDFAITTDGRLDFGEITSEIAQSTGRLAGMIRLRKGQQDSWGGYGVAHIERPERLKQLQKNGYRNARDIVQDVAEQFSAIYEGGNDALFLMKHGNKDSLIIVKLKNIKNELFYDVETAYIVRRDFFKHKKKLWESPQSSSTLDREGRSPTGNNPPSAIAGSPTLQISPGSPEKSSTSSPGGNNSSGQHSTGVKGYGSKEAVMAAIEAAGKAKEAKLLQAIEEHLGKSERDLAGVIMEDFSTALPRLREFAYQTWNVDIGEQEHYLPIIGTGGGVSERTAQEEAREALSTGSHQINVSVDKGMTLDRVDISPWNQKPIELDIIQAFTKGAEREEHLIAYGAVTRRLNSIFKGNGAEARALREDRLAPMYGGWAVSRIQEYINLLAAPKSEPESDTKAAMRKLSGNVALARIAFNIASWLAQYPQSIAPFFAHVGPGAVLQAALLYRTNPNIALEKSAVARNRVQSYAREYLNALKKTDMNRVTKAAAKAAEVGMMGQEHADRTMTGIGWTAVYLSELGKGKSEAEAIAAADRVLNETSPNMEDTQLAPIFRKGSSVKELIRFGAPLNLMWNMLVYKMPTELGNGNIRYAVGLLSATAVANIAVAAMRGAFRDEDDKEQVMRKLAYHGLAEGFTSAVPFSDMANMAGWAAQRLILGKKLSPMQAQVFPLAGTVMKGIVDIGEGEWGKAAFDALDTAGYLKGLPSGQLRKFVRAGMKRDPWEVLAAQK